MLLWVHVILPFTKQTLAANLYNRGLQVRVLWMQLCILAEMVYAFDLKSNYFYFGVCVYAGLAQLVRAYALQAWGQRFESVIPHHKE